MDSNPRDAANSLRRVYVPINQLDVILQRDKQGVLLPRAEFLELYRKAKKNVEAAPRSPGGIVLSRVEYQARLADQQLLLSAKVEFTQFADGWQVLELPLRGLAVEQATLDGNPARLGRLSEAGDAVHLLSDQPGRYTLELELSTTLAAVGSDKVAAFGLIHAPSATLNLSLPAGKHLLVDELHLDRPGQLEEEAAYNVALGGKRETSLRITDRRTQQTTDSLVFATTGFGVDVAPGEVSWQAATTLQIFGAPVDRLTLSVPKSLEIAGVESTGLESWELADADGNRDRTLITLNYRQPIEGSRQIVFRGVMATSPAAPWSVPDLEVSNATSHVGRVLVRHPRGVRLQLEKANGVRRSTSEHPVVRGSHDPAPGAPVVRGSHDPAQGTDRQVSVGANPGDLSVSRVARSGDRATTLTTLPPSGLITTAGVITTGAYIPAANVPAESLLFDVWRENFELSFVTQTKEREVLANPLTSLNVTAGGLELGTIATIETLSAPLFDLDVTLPAEWTVLATLVNDQAVEWQLLPAEAGVHQVRVPLNPPLVPGQKVRFTLSARRDPEQWPVGTEGIEFQLPEIRLPQASVVEGSYVLKADEDFELVPIEISGLDPAHLNLPGERFGYRYQDTRFSGQLRVARKPARLSARTVSFTRLDPQALRSHHEITLDVAGGGLRSLQVELPEAVGTDLRFQLLGDSAQIVEQQPAAPVDGRRVWTLRFDRFIQGRQMIVVDVESPRPVVSGSDAPRVVRGSPDPARVVRGSPDPAQDADRQVSDKPDNGDLTVGGGDLAVGGVARSGDRATTERDRATTERNRGTTVFAVHAVRVLTAERQNGFLAVEASPEQRLTIDAKGADGHPLAEVDPVDLPGASYVPRERIVAAYRYVTPGYQVSLSEERFDRFAVPTAVCYASELSSVLGRMGEFQHRALFNFAAVGVQSVRVRLPESAHLWATLVDGQPIEVRAAGESYLVPLPHTGRPDASRTMTLFYETKVGELDMFGRLKQDPPQLTVSTGDGREQPLEVLDQQWTLYHPEATRLVKSDGRFQPLGDLDRGGLFGRLQQSFRVVSPMELLWNLLFVALAAGVIALLAFGFRRRRWLGLGVTAALLVLVTWALIVPITFHLQEGQRAEYFATGSTNELKQPGMPLHEPADQDESGADSSFSLGSPPAGEEPAAQGFRQGYFADSEKRLTSESRSGQPRSFDADDLTETPSRRPLIAGADDHAETPSGPRFDSGFGLGGHAAPSNPPFGLSPGENGGAQTADPFARPDDSRVQDELAQAGQRASGLSVNGVVRAGEVERRSRTNAAFKGARLSVAVDFDAPTDRARKQFRYLGAGTATTADEPALNLAYENRDDGAALRLFVVALTTVAFWWLRRQPFRVRGVMGALGIAVPLALMTIVPTSWLMVLDGLFLGALGGVALWLVAALSQAVPAYSGSWFAAKRQAQTVGFLIAAALIVNAESNASAQSSVPIQNNVSPNAKSAEIDSITESTATDSTTIIVPYDPSSDPLAAERVFLPREKFLELWNQAYPERRITAPAPIDGLVAGALYAAEVRETNDGDARVSVTGRFVLYSFREHQITLPLLLGRVALESATLDGKPAALATDPKSPRNPFAVVLDKPGLHLLDVKFDLPLQQTGPAGQFTIELNPSPTGRLTFTLPAADLTVRVNGASDTYRRRKTDETERIEVPVDRGGSVTVAWQPKQIRGSDDAIVHSEASSALFICDAGVRLCSEFLFRVRQGSLSEIPFSLPPSLKVQRISGPDVGGWETVGEGNERTLRLFLRRPITDDTRVAFQLYVEADVRKEAASIALPSFAPVEVTRETGTLGVFAEPQFLVRSGAVKGLSQINAAEFHCPPEFLEAPITVAELPRVRATGSNSPNSSESGYHAAPLLAYRYTTRPFQLELSVARREPESKVAAEHALVIGRRKTRTASRFNFELHGAPRGRLAVRLPDDFLTLDVQATGMADWYVHKNRDADTDLIIEFDSPRLGGVELIVEGTSPKDPEDDFAEIYVPYPLDVNALKSTLAVWLDELYSATADETLGWKSINPDQLSEALRRQQDRPAQFAFETNAVKPNPLGLGLSRAKTRLTAEAVTIVTVTETAISNVLTIQWQIPQAAADTFVFTTPARFADRLEFTAAGLRQVSQDKLEDGRIRWTLSLQEPVRGRYFVMAFANFPPAAGDQQEGNQVRGPSLVFEQQGAADDPAVYEPLETQRQYVVLVNQSQNHLDPMKSDAVEPVEAARLPIKARQTLIDQATQIVRLRNAQVEPVWQVRRFAQQQGAPASVNVIDLTTVLAHDGTWRTQAVYSIKNRSRQFLALSLPAGSSVLSVFVKDEPARPVQTQRNGRPIHLIALPKTSEADLAFDVKLVLTGALETGPLPRGFRLLQKEIDLPAPQVVSLQEDAEFGIPVARARWTVHLPEDLDAEPIDNPARNNLTQSTAAQSSLIEKLVDLKEAEEMFRVLEGGYSGRAKYKAYGNLKQLEKSINTLSLEGEVDAKEVQKLQEQQRGFNRRLRENAGRVQVDGASATVIISDGSGSMLLTDESAQQAQIRQQAKELYHDNYGDGVRFDIGPADQDSDGAFGFRLKSSSEMGKPGDARDSAIKGTAAAKGNRMQLMEQNSAQLQEFGRELDRQQSLLQSEATKKPAAQQPGDEPSASRQQPAEGKPSEGQPGGGIAGPGPGVMPGNADAPSSRIAGPTQEMLGQDRGEAAVGGFAQLPAGWTSAGGLSLPIEVPTAGRQLIFTKINGDPKLALRVRPRQSLETGFGLMWTAVWLAVGVAMAVALSRTDVTSDVRRHMPKALLAIGLITFFLLPEPFKWFAFAVALLGGAALGCQFSRGGATN